MEPRPIKEQKLSSNDVRSLTKEDYNLLITLGRDELSDDEMELLFALFEEATLEDAAQSCGISDQECVKCLENIVMKIVPPKPERIRKDGKIARKTLGAAAYQAILATYEFTDCEREIINAAAMYRNQVIAAYQRGIPYHDFVERYRAIREKYDF